MPGNTNTVVGLYDLGCGASETGPPTGASRLPFTRPTSEFGVILANLFSLSKLDMSLVDGIAVSSVVPPLDPILKEVCGLYFGGQYKIKPLFIEPGIKTGLPVLTDNPSEVGADRIVNCVAAFDAFGGPTIVVDMGTATTFDVINKKGEFLGGAIAPGLRISADCALCARRTLAARRYQASGQGHRHQHGRQHADWPVLRLHRPGRRHPGTHDCGAWRPDKGG